MTVSELITREKERLLEMSRMKTLPSLSPKLNIRNIEQYPEQLKNETATHAPLKKFRDIQDEEVIKFSRGHYKYSYRGERHCSRCAIESGLYFETSRHVYFYIYSRDKVIRPPRVMIKHIR